MSRFLAAGAAVLGLCLTLAPEVADAQSIQQILRDAARASQTQRGPIQRGAIQPNAFPNRAQFGGGMVSGGDEWSTVTMPNQCSPGMSITMRYTQAIRGKYQGVQDNPQFDKPREYMNYLSTALYKLNPLGSLQGCESARLTVISPEGQVMARDELRVQGWQWVSVAALNAKKAAATVALDPAIFRPEHIRDLPDTVRDRGELASVEKDACTERAFAAGRAPGARRDVVADTMTACNAAYERAYNEIYDAMAKGVASFTAEQPVSYDGLKALTAAEGAYFIPLDRDSRGQALVKRAFEARRQQIEEVLRPQIIADLNKPGGDQLLSQLFVVDRARDQAYAPYIFDPGFVARLPKHSAGERPFYQRANQRNASNRETTQAAAYATWGEPTSEEIALALMRSMRLAGGRQVTPNVVSVPSGLNRLGIDALDGMANISMQVYDVRKTGCARQAGGYRCTYNLYARVLAGGAYGGDAMGIVRLVGASPDNWFGAANTALFVPSREGWRMPQADQMIANGQAAQLVQLGNVAGDIANAGSSAVGVMTDAGGKVSGGGRDGDGQMETERKQRVQEQQDKDRRSR